MQLRYEAPGRIVAGVLVAAALSQACAEAQNPAKKLKGGAEFELYSRAVNEAASPAKAVQALDEWTQKYPGSDFQQDRFYMYVQAYAGMNPPQPDKVLEYGAKLMSRDVRSVFAGPPTQEQLAGQPIRLAMVNVLLLVATNSASAPAANREQLELGNRAAKLLLEIAPQYFTPENKPDDTSEAQWGQARLDLEARVKSAAIALALKPGMASQAPKDCAAQESAFSKALGAYPESGLAAYHLGSALIVCGSGEPEKLARGLWFVARAAVMDPARSGIAPGDLPAINEYLKKIYVEVHGSENGLDRLKRQAAGSAAPPPGFRIPTEAELLEEQQAELERTNPQLAQWIKMHRLLSQENGELYFSGQLKNHSAPQLWGKLVEARPACRPRELLVAVPLPVAAAQPAADAVPLPPAEIVLKLERALAGQPEAGSELRFDAVPSSFTRNPFLLTMVTSPERVQGLKSAPCAPAGTGSGAKATVENKRK